MVQPGAPPRTRFAFCIAPQAVARPTRRRPSAQNRLQGCGRIAACSARCAPPLPRRRLPLNTACPPSRPAPPAASLLLRARRLPADQRAEAVCCLAGRRAQQPVGRGPSSLGGCGGERSIPSCPPAPLCAAQGAARMVSCALRRAQPDTCRPWAKGACGRARPWLPCRTSPRAALPFVRPRRVVPCTPAAPRCRGRSASRSSSWSGWRQRARASWRASPTCAPSGAPSSNACR